MKVSYTHRAWGNILINLGAPPTGVLAQQLGLNTMVVAWTPPPAPPAAGYQVQVTGATTTTTTDVTSTSRTVSVNQSGMYSIRVMSLSAHLPGQVSAPAEVTVRGTISYIIL